MKVSIYSYVIGHNHKEGFAIEKSSGVSFNGLLSDLLATNRNRRFSSIYGFAWAAIMSDPATHEWIHNEHLNGEFEIEIEGVKTDSSTLMANSHHYKHTS
jgi:hypothetical protein